VFPDDLKTRLKNVHTYAVTPFKRDNLFEVDLNGLARNLEFLIERGVQVIAVGGGTGENEALTNEEQEALARTALQVAGDLALIIPTLPGNLKAALELVPCYAQLGAQIALAMPPLIRGRIPNDLEGVFEYYQVLARATALPLMPYNTQEWPPEFFARLAEIDRIIGFKDPCRAPHNLFKAIQCLGSRFVWIGNKQHDPGVLHLRYQMGIEGFTSGQSNFWPEPELQMHEAALKHDWKRMIELQKQAAPLENLRLENDDAAMVKVGMDLIGLSGGRVRPPRRDLPPEALDKVRKAFAELGLKIKAD